MAWFRKHYTCPCGTAWWDEHDCLCNDRCPTCDAEIEPDDYEEKDAPPPTSSLRARAHASE